VEQPTQEEIRKVAEYWQWVREMLCEHKEWVFDGHGDGGISCGECGRPLLFVPETQTQSSNCAHENMSSGPWSGGWHCDSCKAKMIVLSDVQQKERTKKDESAVK